MNLVTINNNKLWSKEKKNLLLANWCINNIDRYSEEKNKDYLISDYHWNDRLKFKNDLEYVLKTYNLLLGKLSTDLNKIHNLKHPIRYWEIILSKWLWTYLVMTYDRWEIIKSIRNKNDKLSTKCFYYDYENFIPDNDFEYAKSMVHSEDWNHWVYIEILRFFGEVECSFVNKNKIEPQFLYKKEETRSEYYLLNSILGTLSSQRIFTQNLYFSKKFKILYNLIYRQFRYNKKINTKNLNNPTNMEMRNRFSELAQKEDIFVKFVWGFIKYNIPKIYLENFNMMKNLIQKNKVPLNPKIIMTAGDHVYNDAFKFYTAEKVVNGSKYFIFQHGGYYGACASPHALEQIEIKTSDKFFTWGWKEDNKKITPLFLQKTIYKKIIKKRNATGLLIPVLEYYLTPGTYNNTGQPSQKIHINNYIDNIVLFASQINENIFKSCNFKYLNVIKCKYLFNSLKFKFPNTKFITSNKNTYEISKSFKLTVETLNSTGFLESLNLNIPVILIYNQKYCSLRESVIADYEMLRKVKIVHNSPEEAAKFINHNYNDLEKWWNSKLLQKAKNEFCYKFARQSNSPFSDLKRAMIDDI